MIKKIFFSCVTLLTAVLIIFLAQKALTKISRGEKLDPMQVYYICQKNKPQTGNIPEELIFSIAMTESSGYIKARTEYAYGLTGLSRIALREINAEFKMNIQYSDLENPETAVIASYAYMQSLYNRWKNINQSMDDYTVLQLSVISYVWGIGNTLKWLNNTNTSNRYIDEAIPQDAKDYLYNISFWSFYGKKNFD